MIAAVVSVALREAMALHRAGRADEADKKYAQVLKAEPAHVQALRLRGILARDAGRFDQSVRLLRKAVEASDAESDADPEPAAELGLSYLAAGYLQRAEAAFREALGRDPQSTKALANLGALAQYRGHVQEAIDCYRDVLDADPDDVEVRCNLANTLVEAGRGDEALVECEMALAAAPGRPELLATRGAVLTALERYAEAAPVLEAALAHGPDDMALINLALASQQLGDGAAARGALATALRVNPDNARAAADLTALLSAAGSSAEALAVSAAFLGRHPGERLVLAARAVALRDAGDADGARALLDLDRLIDIRQLPVPRSHESLAAFNAQLAAVLRAEPSLLSSPASKSTRGGAQTGEFNLDDQPLLVTLRDALNAELRQLVKHWQRAGFATHPAMAWATEQWTLRLWGTVLGAGGHQLPHIHPLGWLSGVYYVEVPQGLAGEGSNAGALEFGALPARVVCRVPPERRVVAPVPGQLVIFPSYFHHCTLPFASAGERISVAFDVMPVRR